MRVVMVLFLLFPLAAQAAPACKFSRGESVEVADAIDGESLRLADGREVRLIGIHAPLPAFSKAPSDPFAHEARLTLSQWASGQRVTLHFKGGPRVDRYKRVLAHVLREDGAWLQARMLEAGLVRVETMRDARACASELVVLENAARAAKRGLWASSFYAVRQASDLQSLERLEGSYQIIEGRITDIASRQKRIYLNFGDDWRTDFTVTVQPADARLFLKGDASLPAPDRLQAFRQAWMGKRVRMRGWLGKYNGPEMQMTHPEQMELIDEPGVTDDSDAR